MTGGWSSYSWVAGLVLTSVMLLFLMDLAAERYIEVKYDYGHHHPNVEGIITDQGTSHLTSHTKPQDDLALESETAPATNPPPKDGFELGIASEERSFREQIAAFLILEFGVIFHSVIIGLKLGTAGSEFAALYPVIVFHQSFEGLGIGARLSAIPIPKRLSWLPWLLCLAYGITTPVAIAAGLAVRTTYNSGSFTANVVSGILDAISAGILIYTGLVELLARDFFFDPERTKDNKRLAFMIVCLFLGASLMALLGKWA